MTRLPVRATARETYRYLRGRLRLLAAPALIVLGIDIAADSLPPAWQILASFVDSAFIVGLYRAVIAGEERAGPAFFRWNRHLWSYALTALKLGLLLMAAAIALLGASHGYLADLHARPAWQAALLAALILPLVYLALRAILAFPAAALGDEKVFRLSWRAMGGNIGRFLALMLLVLLPPLAAAILVLPPLFVAAGSDSPLVTASSDILDDAATIVMTVAIALSYRRLAPVPEPVPPAP